MPEPISVTTEAFQHFIRRLVANFDAHLDAETLGYLVTDYGRVFSSSVGGEPRDDLLEQVMEWIILNREERGMPRVAEVRRVTLDFLDAERMDRQGREVLERRRRLEEERRGL